MSLKEQNHDDAPECSLCRQALGFLGQLGRRLHYICRGCGMPFSRQVSA